MTIRNLRTRVNMLDKLIPALDKFVIPPDIANEFWETKKSLDQFGTIDWGRFAPPPTPEEEEEKKALTAKIESICNEIRFPEPYGWRHAVADEEQLKQFGEQPHTARKEEKVFQLKVRLAVWECSGEYKERRELCLLRIKDKAEEGFTAAEAIRYERLQEIYPNAEFEPHDPLEEWHVNTSKSFNEASKKFKNLHREK